MSKRLIPILAGTAAGAHRVAGFAPADNQMGDRPQTPEASAGSKRAGDTLGAKIRPGKEITSRVTFEILRVEGVGAASPAEQAQLPAGDPIVAVDGRVFPVTPTYAGSAAPDRRTGVDSVPAGSGPQQAQRVGVAAGGGGHAAPANRDVPRGTGLSTGDKIAMGVGATAVFGCDEAGCLSRLKKDDGGEREKLQQQGRAPQKQ